MRKLLQARRVRVFIAVAAMICLLALMVPQVGNQGGFLAWVFFFPVFLFGLLDLSEVFRDAVCADDDDLPQAPALVVLFQRPPPAFDSILS
jgi:hypothetical protein